MYVHWLAHTLLSDSSGLVVDNVESSAGILVSDSPSLVTLVRNLMRTFVHKQSLVHYKYIAGCFPRDFPGIFISVTGVV